MPHNPLSYLILKLTDQTEKLRDKLQVKHSWRFVDKPRVQFSSEWRLKRNEELSSHRSFHVTVDMHEQNALQHKLQRNSSRWWLCKRRIQRKEYLGYVENFAYKDQMKQILRKLSLE